MNAYPLLSQFLLDTARQPWEEWYGTTRLIFADWIEEHSDRPQWADMVRGIRLEQHHIPQVEAPPVPYWSVTYPDPPDGERTGEAFIQRKRAERAARLFVLNIFEDVRVDGVIAPNLLPPLNPDGALPEDPKKTATPRFVPW